MTRLIGYRDWNWEPDYAAGIPGSFAGMPSIEPTILERPGGWATFGPSGIREMTIPVEFLYQAHEIVDPLEYEAAFRYLFKRLQPFNDTPGELRAIHNDGTLVKTTAVMRVFGFAQFDEAEVNSRRVDFVAVEGWIAMVPTTATVTL